MRAPTLMWLGPVAFLVHDAEEIATVEPWLRAHRSVLPAAAQPFADVTAAQFSVSVAILFAAYVLAAGLVLQVPIALLALAAGALL